jgi:hypothetical protein
MGFDPKTIIVQRTDRSIRGSGACVTRETCIAVLIVGSLDRTLLAKLARALGSALMPLHANFAPIKTCFQNRHLRH